MNFHKQFLILFTILSTSSAYAQGTLDDYNRAYSLRDKYSSRHVYNAAPTPSWIRGTDKFWYVDESKNGRTFTVIDAKKKSRTSMFDQNRLASELSKATGKEIKASALWLDRLTATPTLDTLKFNYSNHSWTFVNNKKGTLTDNGELPAQPQRPHWMVVNDEKGGWQYPSPDRSKSAYVKDNNIYVYNWATGKERQLSYDGTLGNYYSSYLSWSPDSKKIATCKIRPAGEKRYVYYVESSPSTQLQPILHKQEYAKPGDELRFKLPCIYDVESGEALIPDTKLFDKQYDLNGPSWNADSKGITFEYNQRGHQVYRVLEMSAIDGSVRPLVEETSDKYVNYPRIFRQMLSDEKRMIWSSERDNWNHLYMYDRATAKPTHQITKGQWYVRDIVKVDEKNEKIFFSANGVNTDEDPYHIRYYSINFDGTGMTDLTPAKGHHKATFSPDMKYLVDTYSTISEAPVTKLRDAVTGDVIMDIADADISELVQAGWEAPEVFAAPGRDGKTQMWGLIYRPTNFDPNKKYPVIEYIYQGPGDHYVPKSFQPYNWWMTSLSELGFIVVMVDGMGTSFRSREFENICHQNLVDAGLPDHIAWIKEAGKKYPYMDLDRVGIFGCSAGGQESTTAVLHHPEFYKAAYSACGCHDNRMDKIWWNELWLGYPINDSYIKASNVENAHLLQRPLMLVVGEMDDNVDPASTMQVVNALIKANKDFELVVIPGARHTMGEDFGEHKRYDFFVRHLLGVNPPAWSEVRYR
ncbi:MAG: S9 family peptidase [Muribaculum sp.]|nr:S9 family peptidase [Muribaculum sp.]